MAETCGKGECDFDASSYERRQEYFVMIYINDMYKKYQDCGGS